VLEPGRMRGSARPRSRLPTRIWSWARCLWTATTVAAGR